MKEGVVPQLKPSSLASRRHSRGEGAEFSPGRGLSSGTYVGHTPESVRGYGRHVVKLRVPKDHLKVSPEQSSLGVKDPMESLKTHDGAVVHEPVHSSHVDRV
jgi:hypothetical protein